MPKPRIEPSVSGPTSPSVLGSSKTAVEAMLGSSVMARALLGMTARGEKAYSYAQPGEEIIVGFFSDVARYMAVVRRKGPLVGFSPAEMASILALNAPPAEWTSESAARPAAPPPKSAKATRKATLPPRPDTYFRASAKGFLGWQPGEKAFAFFFSPSHPGQPPILLNEWMIERAIG